MMDTLIAVLRWLYGSMAEGMRATTDLTGLPTLALEPRNGHSR